MAGLAGSLRKGLPVLMAAGLLLPLSAVFAQHDKQDWPARQALPALKGTDQHGKLWELKTLRGRPVLINFWATWCGPCKEELPSLEALAARSDAQAPVVLAVNVKEPPARVLQFAQAQGISLPILMDPKGDIARQFGIRIYPTTVLVSATGEPRWRVLGSLDWNEPEAAAWISQLKGIRRR